MLSERDLYDGNISSIPNSTAGLMKLSVAHLRAILRAHVFFKAGSKDELVACIGLLKAGHQKQLFSVNIYVCFISLQQLRKFLVIKPCSFLDIITRDHLYKAKLKH